MEVATVENRIDHGTPNLLFGVILQSVVCCWFPNTVLADVKLPAIFSDHAVLQRAKAVPVWGWAAPAEMVTVTISDQKHVATTDENGTWHVTLEPLDVGSTLTMIVEGKNRLEIKDIQVGDVWLCSGQSNMEWSVGQSRDSDLEVPEANFPNIRLISVATEGSQTPRDDFQGHRDLCAPETVSAFSAIGYFFGREMYLNLRVPIGLIDNSWGGSTCEAWVRRDLMEGNSLFEPMLNQSDKTAAEFDEKSALAKYNTELAAWKEKAAAARSAGDPDPPGEPWWCIPRTGQIRPANLYNGRLRPIMPYAISGVIWYQGEANMTRADQYRELFPLMIKNWREDWRDELPFYFAQLANMGPESEQPGDSAWSELREAQTMTLEKMPHTGQAVIIDVGEANDVHPKNKQAVARRLARLALAESFGQTIAHKNARYKSKFENGHAIRIDFADVNGRLQTVDGKPVTGFAIADVSRKWVWADAAIVGHETVEVHSDAVPTPVAVRYAWADNPACNLIDSASLPVTPFRTDDWRENSR